MVFGLVGKSAAKKQKDKEKAEIAAKKQQIEDAKKPKKPSPTPDKYTRSEVVGHIAPPDPKDYKPPASFKPGDPLTICLFMVNPLNRQDFEILLVQYDAFKAQRQTVEDLFKHIQNVSQKPDIRTSKWRGIVDKDRELRKPPVKLMDFCTHQHELIIPVLAETTNTDAAIRAQQHLRNPMVIHLLKQNGLDVSGLDIVMKDIAPLPEKQYPSQQEIIQEMQQTRLK